MNTTSFKGVEVNNTLNKGHNIEQWCIVEIDFGSNKGSVQSGKRPAIVISNNVNNMHSPNITVVPMTTKLKTTLPTHIFINKELANKLGIDTESTILCEQIQTVSKASITTNRGDVITFPRLKVAIVIRLFVQIFGSGILNKLKETFVYELVKLAPTYKR